jgi:nucleoid-associated protein YgaU
MAEVERPDSLSRFPERHRQLQETLRQGEGLLQDGNVDAADQRYASVIRQAEELQRSLAEELAREESERRVQDALRQAEELRRAEEPPPLVQQEELRQTVRVQEPPPAVPPPARVEKEPPRPATYTVKRGETLPQIAARPMIYGDPLLWPLIYRANRDQIRDPRRLWPGQILRIPRTAGKEEMAEARRFAQDKQMP